MRTQKALKNLIFNMIQQATALIINFFMPPILVSNFGSVINGLVSTIRQIMQYVQLTGAGIAQASTYAMYKPLSENDHRTLSGIFNATKKMFRTAGNWFSILVLLLALIYPLIIDKDVDYLTTFLLVIVIGISGASEFYLCGKYTALLTANQESFVVAIAQIIGNISNLLLLVVLVHFKQNIVIVQLGMSSIYLFRILILYWYVHKHFDFIDKNEKPLFSCLSQRNDVLVHQISALVVMGSSTLIVSLLLGLKEASVFSVYLIVFQGINAICGIVSNAIYASFGDVIVKNERKVLLNSFSIFELAYFILISIVFSCTFLLIMPFINLYTVNMVDANYYRPMLAVLFVIVGVANNIRIPSTTIVNAAGHFKETKYRAIFEMILNVLGQFTFGKFFGLNGILLGCILSYSYRTLDFIFYTHKYILKNSPLKSFGRIFLNLFASVFIVMVMMYFLSPAITNYLEWIKYGFIYFVLISSFILLINFIFERRVFLNMFNLIMGIVRK